VISISLKLHGYVGCCPCFTINNLDKSIGQVRAIAKEWYGKKEILLYNKSGYKVTG
jgi:hypothetical protein